MDYRLSPTQTVTIGSPRLATRLLTICEFAMLSVVSLLTSANPSEVDQGSLRGRRSLDTASQQVRPEAGAEADLVQRHTESDLNQFGSIRHLWASTAPCHPRTARPVPPSSTFTFT